MNPNRRIHKGLEVESHQDLHHDENRSLTLNQLSGELSNAELAARCEGEIKKICLGKPSSERYSFELLHRATLHGDKEAWLYIKQCFRDLVLQWLRLHPQRGEIFKLGKGAHYVDRTFERFFQSTGFKQSKEFDSLGDALHFLQACLNGVILDTRRAYLRKQAILVQSEGFQTEDNIKSNDVWNTVQMVIPNGYEQRLSYLLLQCGLKPKEIAHFYPREYSDMHSIYHLRGCIMNRLVRNADLFY
ncbi:MAG: hypothetical protein ACXWPS_03215 [Ktedonobacteraceae bacterium]